MRHDLNNADDADSDRLAKGGQIALIGLFLLAVLYTFYMAREVVLPIFVALYLSFIFRPVVRRARRVGIPAALTAAMILVVIIGVIAFAVTMLRDPAVAWAQRVPQVMHRIEDKLQPIKHTLDQARAASEDLQRAAQGARPSNQKIMVQDSPILTQVLGYTLSTVVQTVIIITLFFFFLLEGGVRAGGAMARLLSPRHVEKIELAIGEIENRVSTYLGTLALINLGVGICTAVAMLLLGVPNPLLWGVIAALLGPIPYVGPMLTIAILLIVGISTYDHLWMMLAPALAYLVINQIESEVVTPIFQSAALKLSPVGVFISIMIWTWLWGALGALLAVPILVVMVVIIEHMTKPQDHTTLSERLGQVS